MKGFKKLFLGLIFLTLFGVGFKIEVKADPIAPTLGLTVPSDWSSESATINATFTCEADDFPQIGTFTSGYTTGKAWAIYELKVIDGSGNRLGDSYKIKLITTGTLDAGTSDIIQTRSYKIWKATEDEPAGDGDDGAPSSKIVIAIPKGTVKQFISGVSSTAEKKKSIHTTSLEVLNDHDGGVASVTPSVDAIDSTPDEDVIMYKVSVKSSSGASVDFDKGEIYLLPGDSENVTATVTPKTAGKDDAVYKYKKWESKNGKVTTTNNPDYKTQKITMNTGTGAGNDEVTMTFDSIKLSLTDEITTDTKLKSGDKSTHSINQTGGSYESTNFKKLFIQGIEDTTATWSNDTLKFTVPTGVTKGSAALIIEMDDGNKFRRDLTITEKASQYTITFDGNGGTPSTPSMTTGTDGKLSSLPKATMEG